MAEWFQHNPPAECPRCSASALKCRCYNPRLSYSTRALWAKREAALLTSVLIRARKAKLHTYFGVATFGCDVLPQDVAATMRSFVAAYRGTASIRWYLSGPDKVAQSNSSYSNKSSTQSNSSYSIKSIHRSKSKPISPHVHYLIISANPISANINRRNWTKALGQLHIPNRTKTHLSPVSNPTAAARYVSGYTQAKRKAALFRLGKDIRVAGGTKNFFSGNAVKQYHNLCRQWAVSRAARQDEYILDHCQIEFYENLVDAAYKKTKPKARKQQELDAARCFSSAYEVDVNCNESAQIVFEQPKQTDLEQSRTDLELAELADLELADLELELEPIVTGQPSGP